MEYKDLDLSNRLTNI